MNLVDRIQLSTIFLVGSVIAAIVAAMLLGVAGFVAAVVFFLLGAFTVLTAKMELNGEI